MSPWLLTQELVGRGGGEVELLLQVLAQEGSEAGHHGDLHAGCQDDAGEHGVGQQVLGHFGDHYKRGKRERCVEFLSLGVTSCAGVRLRMGKETTS